MAKIDASLRLSEHEIDEIMRAESRLRTGERWRDLKGVMMIGDARVLESADDEAADDHLGSAQINLGEKHNLTSDGVVSAYAPTASGRSRRWIVFTPKKVVTWNNEKLKQGR